MIKEIKTKKITLTLLASQQERAREISKELLGESNISGLFAHWINTYKPKRKKEGEKV